VRDVTEAPSVQRETALAKVAVDEDALFALITRVRDAGARVLDVVGGSVVVEITDSPARVDAFVEDLRTMGLRELMRTGRLAMMRGQVEMSRPQAFREQGDGAGEEDAA
jgi:acetolactate synthase-1/3 small subunit